MVVSALCKVVTSMLVLQDTKSTNNSGKLETTSYCNVSITTLYVVIRINFILNYC
jgi:hypothetical protein